MFHRRLDLCGPKYSYPHQMLGGILRESQQDSLQFSLLKCYIVLQDNGRNFQLSEAERN